MHGQGWETGRISQEEMIRTFNQSRINLNLSNASVQIAKPKPRFLKRLARSLGLSGKPAPEDAKDPGQYTQQIKGRNFEIPGCGGFQLTGHAENLGEYYVDGEEVVCFNTFSELLEKARYYQDHEEARARIARAGYARTLSEHTYAHRFDQIFKTMGLPQAPLADLLAGQVQAGQVKEIE